MMHSQNVVIAFRDCTQPGEQPLNFKIPRTTVPSLILGGKERDILVLTKLKPFDTWGSYDYQVSVKYPKSKEMQSKTNLNLAKVDFATNEQSSNVPQQNLGPVMQDSNMGASVSVGNDVDMY